MLVIYSSYTHHTFTTVYLVSNSNQLRYSEGRINGVQFLKIQILFKISYSLCVKNSCMPALQGPDILKFVLFCCTFAFGIIFEKIRQQTQLVKELLQSNSPQRCTGNIMSKVDLLLQMFDSYLEKDWNITENLLLELEND